jgi:hypothetical protein
MKANQFTGCVKKVQENAARNENQHEFALVAAISNGAICCALTLPNPSGTMKFMGA